MDKAKRRSLLQDRFKALGGVVLHNHLPTKPKSPPRAPIACNNWTAFLSTSGPVPKWLKVQIRSLPKGIRIKRVARVSPLTKIAEQLPAKLPRVLF